MEEESSDVVEQDSAEEGEIRDKGGRKGKKKEVTAPEAP